jgi:adenylate kinase family enzyme
MQDPLTAVQLVLPEDVRSSRHSNLCLQVQRTDDTEEKARNRLQTYHSNVDAVLGFYNNQLVKVCMTS